MGKSEELQRMERELSGQPELREKLDAEIKRIVDAGEAACNEEAVAKAAALTACSRALGVLYLIGVSRHYSRFA